jgi:hypothetical protein
MFLELEHEHEHEHEHWLLTRRFVIVMSIYHVFSRHGTDVMHWKSERCKEGKSVH